MTWLFDGHPLYCRPTSYYRVYCPCCLLLLVNQQRVKRYNRKAITIQDRPTTIYGSLPWRRSKSNRKRNSSKQATTTTAEEYTPVLRRRQDNIRMGWRIGLWFSSDDGGCERSRWAGNDATTWLFDDLSMNRRERHPTRRLDSPRRNQRATDRQLYSSLNGRKTHKNKKLN